MSPHALAVSVRRVAPNFQVLLFAPLRLCARSSAFVLQRSIDIVDGYRIAYLEADPAGTHNSYDKGFDRHGVAREP